MRYLCPETDPKVVSCHPRWRNAFFHEMTRTQRSSKFTGCNWLFTLPLSHLSTEQLGPASAVARLVKTRYGKNLGGGLLRKSGIFQDVKLSKRNEAKKITLNANFHQPRLPIGLLMKLPTPLYKSQHFTKGKQTGAWSKNLSSYNKAFSHFNAKSVTPVL